MGSIDVLTPLLPTSTIPTLQPYPYPPPFQGYPSYGSTPPGRREGWVSLEGIEGIQW